MTVEHYEIDTTGNPHTITSSVKLCCAETGRVMAVFCNDYDAEAVIAAAPRPTPSEQLEIKTLSTQLHAVTELLRAREREIAELKQPAQPIPTPEQSCDWREDEDGIWHTACGESFEVTEGSPTENGMKFCHSCRRRLKEIYYAAG